MTGSSIGKPAGRAVGPAPEKQAKQRTGIETDTELIPDALASVALEDNFPTVFKGSRGVIDPDLKLGF